MARPKAEFPSREDIAALIDSEGRLALRVTPGSRVEEMTIVEGALQLKVRAKPQDGAANDAVIKLVGQALGIAPSRIAILRGATSRHKQVAVDI